MSDLPAAARRVRGRVGTVFLAAHALAPEDAIAYVPAGALDRRWFDYLIKTGAIRTVAPGRYYLDLIAYHRGAEAFSRRWVPIAMVVPVVLALVAMLFYRG